MTPAPLRRVAYAATELAPALLAALVLGGAAGAQQTSTFLAKTRKQVPPDNVLILVADDVGVDMCGIYGEGSNVPSTPVIDALAAEGVLFRNAWAQPTCSATRAAIQTGRYGFRTGVGTIIDGSVTGLPLSEVTLPEMLDLGSSFHWATAAIGKWHLGHPNVGGPLAPNLAGYEHFAGTLGNLLAPTQDYYSWDKVVDGVQSHSNVYATTAQVDDALAWLATAPEPWLCYVAFSAAHNPFHAPPASLHTVDLSSASSSNPFPYYSAMVEAMDTEIGRLLDGIAPSVRARTNVFFLGDNGTPVPVLQPPLTQGKFSLFEGGLNVPFIVSGPAVRAPGRESAALVHVVDLFATIAELSGVKTTQALPSVALDSVSFRSVLRNEPAGPVRTTVYAEKFSPNGVGNLLPPPDPCPDPSATVCQMDVGFGGPGNAALSICGSELYGGASAQLLLTSSFTDAPGALYVGKTFNPTPAFGGTIVPVPFSNYVPFVTDSQGVYTATVIGNAPNLFYYQAAIFDPSLSGAAEITNALAVEEHGSDIKAARDARYKLIDNLYLCQESLFDLLVDPLEQVNLLDGTLTAPELASYQQLQAAIDATTLP